MDYCFYIIIQKTRDFSVCLAAQQPTADWPMRARAHWFDYYIKLDINYKRQGMCDCFGLKHPMTAYPVPAFWAGLLGAVLVGPNFGFQGNNSVEWKTTTISCIKRDDLIVSAFVSESSGRILSCVVLYFHSAFLPLAGIGMSTGEFNAKVNRAMN